MPMSLDLTYDQIDRATELLEQIINYPLSKDNYYLTVDVAIIFGFCESRITDTNVAKLGDLQQYHKSLLFYDNFVLEHIYPQSSKESLRLGVITEAAEILSIFKAQLEGKVDKYSWGDLVNELGDLLFYCTALEVKGYAH
jgi:hypothetical protein